MQTARAEVRLTNSVKLALFEEFRRSGVAHPLSRIKSRVGPSAFARSTLQAEG
jgi:hypothetical protein